LKMGGGVPKMGPIITVAWGLTRPKSGPNYYTRQKYLKNTI